MSKAREKRIILAIVALVVVTMGFLAYLLHLRISSRNAAPVIVCATDEISVSVGATDADLLAGVSAMDAEDGDITHKVVIESISAIAKNGRCTITYAVSDSDNQVSSVSRTLNFFDYHSPKFQFSADFIFISGDSKMNKDLTSFIKAYDCFEGDISSRISMSIIDTEGLSSTKQIEFRVSNNYGDVSSIVVDVVNRDKPPQETPNIELTEYLVYVKPESIFDPLDYVDSITIVKDSYSPSEYGVDKIYADLSDFDQSTPGTYRIPIYCENGDHIGSTALYVVVDDQ